MSVNFNTVRNIFDTARGAVTTVREGVHTAIHYPQLATQNAIIGKAPSLIEKHQNLPLKQMGDAMKGGAADAFRDMGHHLVDQAGNIIHNPSIQHFANNGVNTLAHFLNTFG